MTANPTEVMTENKCEWCGNELSDEEVRNPSGEKGMCDECYHEHEEFTCCRCSEYDNKKIQHRFIVVFDAVAGVECGIYEVIDYPYFGGSILGGSMFTHALRKTPASIDWENESRYPCGHLCLGCQRKLNLRQSNKGKSLHAND